MDTQTIRCSVTINRVAPWAKDASVSTKGYERGARFYSSDTTANEVNAWIATNAPEVDPNGTRQPVFTRGEAFTYPDRTGTMCTAYENRDYYFLNGRDARGWRTEVYVQFTHPEIVEEPGNDYATAAYDVDVYKGDPKNGNLVANYTVTGFEEARAIAARFTEDGRQCVIQRFDKQPLIGEFDYWCKKIGAYPYTASDGRTYPAIRQEVTA